MRGGVAAPHLWGSREPCNLPAGSPRQTSRMPEAPPLRLARLRDSDPDETDAARARDGDAVAFERLYRRHAARVHAIARRVVGGEEADDLTQEAFLRAWEKLPGFRGESAFGTWLHRLTVNHCLTRLATLRTRWTKEEPEAEFGMDVFAGQGSGDLHLQIDFEEAVERLPPGMRRVFTLHDVEGFTHEEIGAQLGIAPGTSKSQLNRARLALRRWVE